MTAKLSHFNLQDQHPEDVGLLPGNHTNINGIVSSKPNQKNAQRHRFQTNMALCLTAFVVVALGCLSLHASYYSSSSDSSLTQTINDNLSRTRWLEQDDNNDNNNDNNNGDYKDHSCHDLFQVTPNAGHDQCQFAKTCNDGEGVWLPFVFCSKHMSTLAICGILSPFIMLWLVLMFRLLGSTAEDYFSPSLEYFSVKAQLPPRFAGVTLLALGNGAADVSATVNAITSDVQNGYQMSLGALTGAAMFVGGVVSAVIVMVAGGVPCRGALVRDVLALGITMLVVWVHFGSGKIGPEAISLFLSLYGLFVVVVLVADAYHRGVVLPRQALQSEDVERQRQLQAADEVHNELASGGINNSNAMEFMQGGGQLPNNQQQQQQQPTSALGNVLSALSNYDRTTSSNAEGWGVGADELGQDRPVMLHGTRGILHGNPNPALVSNEQAALDGGGNYAMLQDANDRICAEPGPAGGNISYNWMAAWDEAKQEIMDHAQQVWEDIAYDGDIHPVDKFLLICEIPFTLLRKVTVPIPCDGYYCRGLVALSLAISPAWMGFYLWYEHELAIFSLAGLFYMGIFWAIVLGIAALVLRYAPAGDGSMALFAATPIAFYGFIIGATWVDAIADHLVEMLGFIGILLRIPGPVIGLTILAWGNSVADLSANVAMARKGLANMAMTACFAGPVFNILIGLGLGFSSLAAQERVSEIDVELSKSVITGCVFVLVNCAAILGVGIFYGQGHIPKQYGYLALTLYTVYVISSVVLQYI